MTLTVAHIAPIVALIAGILILIVPRLLNYIVAVYLIVIGLIGLNSVHHFITGIRRARSTLRMVAPAICIKKAPPGKQ